MTENAKQAWGEVREKFSSWTIVVRPVTSRDQPRLPTRTRRARTEARDRLLDELSRG